jgi:hypothetical protein
MSSNVFSTIELIAVISIYCAAFGPILCWVLSQKAASVKLVPAPLGKAFSSSVK